MASLRSERDSERDSEKDGERESLPLLASSSVKFRTYSSLDSEDGGSEDADDDLDTLDDSVDESKSFSLQQALRRLRSWAERVWSRLREVTEPYDLFTAVAVLVLCASVERVTFKVMIDRMIPYKFILLEIIFFSSWAIFGLITLFLQHSTKEITPQMLTFPQRKILLMALVDALQFFGVVYSGIGVSPTMTIILLHASTLFILLGSRCVFPNHQYGTFHQVGVVLIGIAIALSLYKIVHYDYLYNSDNGNGFIATKSALIYILSCCLHGFCTLYKEKALVDWAQPVNIYFLSSRLFLYQFFITLILSMMFYIYEAIIGNGERIPSGLYYGWKCFLGRTPDTDNRDDDMTAYYMRCSHSLWLVLGYVLATIGVMTSINVVLRLNSLWVGKSICAAILVAFVVLWIYDVNFTVRQSNQFIFGGSVGSLDLISIVFLLIGMEIYGRDPEPDVELITNYGGSSSSPSDNEKGKELPL